MKYFTILALLATAHADGDKKEIKKEDRKDYYWNKYSKDGVISWDQFTEGAHESFSEAVEKYDRENPPFDADFIIDYMFEMADVNQNESLDEKEFTNYMNYYLADWKKDYTDENGVFGGDMKAIFDMEDFNNNGLLSDAELINAMFRAEFPVPAIKEAVDTARTYTENPDGMNLE